MKNREKYRDEILDYKGNNFCQDFVERVILENYNKKCGDNCARCRLMQDIWMDEEYIEPKKPKIDWENVAVDTPVLVKQYEDDPWRKRYFAKYANDMVYTYANGASSWSDSGDENTIDWQYAKLAEEEAK